MKKSLRPHLWYTQALVSGVDFEVAFPDEPGRSLGTPQQLIEAAPSDWSPRVVGECELCGRRTLRRTKPYNRCLTCEDR